MLKPFPLQWEKRKSNTAKEKQQFERDRKKVIDVWESMGFKHIADTK